MTPERQIQTLRTILTIVEARSVKYQQADAEAIQGLRQLLEAAMRNGDATKDEVTP